MKNLSAETYLYEFARFRLLPDERLLLRDSQPVQLAPKVFDTLLVLVENGGHLVEKDELLEKIWSEAFVEEATLARNISILRKVLGEKDKGQKFIETVPKRGYRFTNPVRRIKIAETSAPDFAAEAAAPVIKHSAPLPPPSLKTRRPVLWLMIAVTIAAGIFFSLSFWSAKPSNNQPIKSIAVLPFREIGGPERDRALELGMADSVIMRLGKIRQIVVRPTGAVSRYLETEVDAASAGKDLMTEAVLEGTIQREQDRVRITARLIKTADGAQLWAEKFETKFTDIFTVQDSISDKIAQSLNLKLSGDEQSRLARRETFNAQAYEAFLKGKYFLDKYELQKAIDYFTQAIVADSNLADAYAGLADAYALQVSSAIKPPQENLPKARTAAERALEMEPEAAESHAALAHILWLSWEWQAAEKEFLRALELSPNLAKTRFRYSIYLSAMARHDEAIAEAKRAAELDPTSFSASQGLERAYYFARRFDETLAASEKTLELNPHALNINSWREMAFEQKGMRDEAVETRLKVMTARKSLPEEVEGLRRTYREAGWTAFWQKEIERKKQRAAANKFYVLPYNFARDYARLGDYDQALAWLERCEQERSDHLTLIKVDPIFDPLRGNARFIALLTRIGLNYSY